MFSLVTALIVTQEAVPGLAPGDLEVLIKALSDGYAAFGWLGALAAGLVVLVRLLRLIPAVEAVWQKMPRWAQVLIVFVLAFAGAGIPAGLGGGGVVGILSAGLAAGLAALGLHQTVKSVAPGVASPRPPQ